MRLTLRTLLAYLDRTLDKESSETLHGKVMESSFASQLIKRIKVVLTSPTLGAASPVAAGPVEEPNVISEYLDSTLPNEQVAEIERACLESDALLAEAAGCHQVLTLVLGKPAEVSPALRERIYGLPQSNEFRSLASGGNRSALTGDSFASLAIPEDPTLAHGAGGLAGGNPTRGFGHTAGTADAGALGDPQRGSMPGANEPVLTPPRNQPMRPVGPSDSGVSDAPTRLRNAGLVDEHGKGRDGQGRDAQGRAIAGSRPRKKDLSDLYGGGIRPSRITPWLVSLALAGVFLFALSQLFLPLLDRRTAMRDQQADDKIESYGEVPPDGDEPLSASQLAGESPEIEVPSSAAPPMLDVGSPVRSASETEAGRNATEMLPPPLGETSQAELEAEPQGPQPTLPAIVNAPHSVSIDAIANAAATPALSRELAGPADSTASQPDAADAAMSTETTSEAMATEAATAADMAAANAAAGTATAADAASVAATAPAATPSSPAAAAPAADGVAAVSGAVATLASERTFVAVRDATKQWHFVPSGAGITANTEIVCAPTFRARLAGTDGLDLTMAGPTTLGMMQKDAEQVLYIAGGRVLLRHKTPDAVLGISLSGRPLSIKFKNADTLVALELEHLRLPGDDPLVEASHERLVTVMIVQGAAELTSGSATSQLNTGQQWQIFGALEPEQSDIKAIEEWIDEPDPNDASLESLARSGLLSMMNDTQSLELSLRESIPFRRAEVGALAGRTLLWLGHGDIYFGGDGILNQPRQKAYWDDHYQELLAVIDQSARSAEELKLAIEQVEAADGAQMFELLAGYSQPKLKSGGDSRLVELLDSPSMAVRVLALETLRDITGTTLNFHAEQDNPIRRAPDLKKWEARVRKGDIRWPERMNAASSEPVASP